MKKIVGCVMAWLVSFHLPAQYLSHLQAGSDDPLYSTYAAPLARSSYKLDQGYQMLWNDPARGIDFISSDGPNLGMAFGLGNQVRYTLQEMHAEPIVTASYSDMVRFHYRPFRDIAVEAFFDVYSSSTAIREYTIQNTGTETISLSLMPFFYYTPFDFTGRRISQDESGTFSDRIQKKHDGWMQEHHIPVIEDMVLTHMVSEKPDSVKTFLIGEEPVPGKSRSWINRFRKGLPAAMVSKGIRSVIVYQTVSLSPGEKTVFRTAIHLQDLLDKTSLEKTILNIDLQSLEANNLKLYAKIPKLDFHTEDEALTYWSAFNLMRQCMMPPEGKCTYNYYVFSREPKWGWGYGGQVFHESLTMVAYALMDPVSAMNSQRVYMERQEVDGYINYRTGPYLDETIIHNGMKTSSAPWYNYQNLEIFKITKDKQFLKEAFASGKRFYEYYTSSRDSNQNGLCSWGAHAELESVRDARVAVWDKVGWPGNFEGPDVNAMLVKEARSLSEMAAILGLASESKAFKEQADRRSALINRKMWDEADGFYFNINQTDGSFTFKKANDLKIKEIIGFLPLWAGIADKGNAARLVSHLTDTSTFWRPFGVPTLSAKDDYYNPIGYWNGPVWVQWNYLIYRGLKDYGYHQEASELAGKVMGNVIYHLKNDHIFWEFYSADDHMAGWNKTYIWAGIVARMMYDERNPFN